jgi:hypothetical protein
MTDVWSPVRLVTPVEAEGMIQAGASSEMIRSDGREAATAASMGGLGFCLL